MANPDNPNGFTFVKTTDGTIPELISVVVKNSVAIADGDALIVDSGTGNVDIALANSGAIFGVAASAVTAAASGTANRTILCYPALPNYIFEAQCEGTYAASIRFTAVDIEGATGVMEVNENATTEQVFQIIGENPNSEIGANTRVRGIFIRSEYVPLLAAL